jgi:transcriptional regulator with XRE-family HTH domain
MNRLRTLKEIRKAKGYSLRKLAAISNCTFPQLSRFETGKVLPSETTRAWLGTILGEEIFFPILPEMTSEVRPSESFTDIRACAKRFRYLLRMIKALPEDQRNEFSQIIIHYMVKLTNNKEE